MELFDKAQDQAPIRKKLLETGQIRLIPEKPGDWKPEHGLPPGATKDTKNKPS
jgi:hypothetical protein